MHAGSCGGVARGEAGRRRHITYPGFERREGVGEHVAKEDTASQCEDAKALQDGVDCVGGDEHCLAGARRIDLHPAVGHSPRRRAADDCLMGSAKQERGDDGEVLEGLLRVEDDSVSVPLELGELCFGNGP